MAGEYRWHLMKEVLFRRREALILFLGGKCVSCGAIEDLEFHHMYGKSWRSRDYSRIQRLKKYEEDAKAGQLQLLCEDCHRDFGCHPADCFCEVCREGDEF